MFTSRTTVLATVAALFATGVTALALTSSEGEAHTKAVAQSEPVVYQLPRVVITGRSQRTAVAEIIELPRVVVTRRADRPQTLISQDDRAASVSRT